ncbi:hypothetical protein [Streptomyces sp. CC210A]|uniref:hypothetical protein n=1 Tax=Streptomyces sp. CC210A TaxID=2898184 RepID=UPI001F2522DD|nr:hypothetical protein [Streptomyces sp. CC210A]
MTKHVRAAAVAGLSALVCGTMLAVPAQAAAAGKAKAKTATVKFDCKVRTVADRFGVTEYKGCKSKGKYRVSLRTKDTKWDGWGSHAALKRNRVTIINVSAIDGKGKWSAWKTTGWTTNKGPYRVSA